MTHNSRCASAKSSACRCSCGGSAHGGGSSRGGQRRSYYPESEKPVQKNPAPRRNVFISFHSENDESQVDLLRHQATDERFDLDFSDHSVKEPFDEKWKSQCEEKMKKTSTVIVMIGEKTHEREAVQWEINKAYELGKKVIGVRIYKDEKHIIPKQMLQENARVVSWNMKDIQNALDRN